jgi:hypothetical protein
MLALYYQQYNQELASLWHSGAFMKLRRPVPILRRPKAVIYCQTIAPAVDLLRSPSLSSNVKRTLMSEMIS